MIEMHLSESLLRGKYEALRVKLKMQYRPKEIRDTRNTPVFLERQIQHKKEATGTTKGKGKVNPSPLELISYRMP